MALCSLSHKTDASFLFLGIREILSLLVQGEETKNMHDFKSLLAVKDLRKPRDVEIDAGT